LSGHFSWLQLIDNHLLFLWTRFVLHALCTVIICSDFLDLYSSETYVTEFYISIQVYFASVFSRIFLLMELRDLKVLLTYLLET
jgi:hypothetical protein